MRSFNMKIRRNTKPIVKSKSQVVNIYQNTNPRINNLTDSKTNKCCHYNCHEQQSLNNINIGGIKWETWKNYYKFNFGKAIIPGSTIDISMNGTTRSVGTIVDARILNNKACLQIGSYDCSKAFNDTGITLNLIIRPSNMYSHSKVITGTTDTSWNMTLNGIHNIDSNGDDLVITNDTLIFKTMNREGSIYRAPIGGFRKTLCNEVNKKPVQEVYKDPYSKNFEEIKKQKICYNQTIRSGMQEKNKYNCKTNCCNKEKYNFSYNEYNKNYRLNTYEKNLEINEPIDTNSCLIGNCTKTNYVKSSGLACKYCSSEKCNNNRMVNTIWKPNNNKFKVQGSVSSGTRLDRLKLDTIKVANSKCKDNMCKTLSNGDKIGRGKYFSGKPRFDGWMFNKSHKELLSYGKKR